MRAPRDELLHVHPHCLMFFVDDSGDEEFSDPNHRVYVLGGCAIMAGAIEVVLRSPWREMKARHFGGADVPLHASELRYPTLEQINAIADFFRKQEFGRFAVAMTANTQLSDGLKPIEIMPGALRQRWQELTGRASPVPVEIAFIHEASTRGDPLLERYFGETVVHIDGKRVKVHHGLMPKGDEALEVADFVVQAVGGQARRGVGPGTKLGKDFEVIFQTNPLWSSYIAMDNAKRSDPRPAD